MSRSAPSPTTVASTTQDAPPQQSASSATAALVVDAVAKSFGDTRVLAGVSLELPAGSVCALLGPSGSGKTTLLRAIAGLETIDAGTISVGGHVVSGPDVWIPAERRRVGMVFQDWALFPQMTVADNVAFGLSKNERRSGRVAEVLELVGLSEFAERQPGTLSGGQQQRVALARALAPRPTLLLLDEPFSNLDSTLRARVRTEVHALLAAAGVTAVFVTHDQDEAFVLGDLVAVVHDGRFAQVAAPRELYRRPSTAWVARFVGEANLLDAVVSAGVAHLSIGSVPVATGVTDGEARVLVRPEHLAVDPALPSDTNHANGVVQLVEYYGHDAVVIVALDAPGASIRARVKHADVVRGDAVAVRYSGPPTVAYPLTES